MMRRVVALLAQAAESWLCVLNADG